MKVLGCRVLLVAIISVFFTAQSEAQSYIYDAGTPRYTTAEPVELGFVNLANGNLHLEIPITASPQRGKRQFSATLVYDSRIWRHGGAWTPDNVTVATISPVNSWGGWRLITSGSSGHINLRGTNNFCRDQFGHPWAVYVDYDLFQWVDPSGVTHAFPGVSTTVAPTPGCGSNSPPDSGMANDSSGFRLDANGPNAKVYAPDGTQVYPNYQDANGNSFTTDPNNDTTDTLGRKPITTINNCNGNSNQICYDVLNSQGGTSRFTVTLITLNVTTAFAESGVSEYSGPVTVIQKIDLPDGSFYSFGYDGTFALLNSLRLPTGETVSYSYQTPADVYFNSNRWVSSRTTAGGQWIYSLSVLSHCTSGQVNCKQQMTVHRPNGDETVYTFTVNNGAWNSEVKTYTGNFVTGQLLTTVTTTYDFSNPCTPAPCSGAQNIRAINVATDVNSSNGTLHKQLQYAYDNPQIGNITAIKEWNYTLNAFGPTPDRQTDISYLTTPSYTAKNILNLPSTITLSVSGAPVPSALTRIDYDTKPLTNAVGASHHDDTNFGLSNNTRGNPTEMSQLVSGTTCSPNSTTCLTTTNFYDITGQVVQTIDPKGNSVTFSYVDNFFNDNGANPPASYAPPQLTNAYLTQTTLPIIGAANFGYYFGTGNPAFARDQNSADTYQHYVDPLDRLKTIFGPIVNLPPPLSGTARQWTLLDYPTATQLDAYSTLNDTTPATGCTSCRHGRVNLDGLGRITQASVTSDPQGAVQVSTTYNNAGQVFKVSNPFRSTSDPTYGLETFGYDGLGRVIQVTHHDGQVARTYFGSLVSTNGGRATPICNAAAPWFPILVIDEAGKKRQSWVDGFGRLMEVDEPDLDNNLNLKTCYSYNLNDDLTLVQQVGPITQTRDYQYDAIHRLTRVITPESGTEYLYYTTAAGALCSGDAAPICRRVDARSITTTYTYDALNRLTGKTYSSSTPAVSYSYDQTGVVNGLTITNGKGRRTSMADGSGTTAWSYDAAGNPLTVRKTINAPGAVTKNISYTYNLNGSLASITYPSGRTVSYSYNNAFLPVSAVDSANAINYVLNAQYAPQYAISSALFGNDHGNGGTTLTQGFNNRLQPVQFRATNSTRTIIDLNFNFNLGGGVNNGSVAQVLNNRDHTRDQTFLYDELNRVKRATSTGWDTQFVYDRYGNLLQKQSPGGGELLSVIVDAATNRIQESGYAYDAAGNMINDGLNLNSYTYDAENKMLTANNGTSITTFKYDGDGVRVFKSGYRLYWTGMGTETLAETFTSGGNKREYVYFAGRRVAMVDLSVSGNNCMGIPPDCARYYFYGDHLGSGNVLASTSGGTTVAEYDFFPYGGKRVITSSSIDPHYDFTGKEWDSEDSLNHFLFRDYSPRLGRFMGPDPLQGNIGNPQSLNRYAYVLNNPGNLIDPLGLCEHSATWQDEDGTVHVICLDPEDPDEGRGERNDAIGSGPGRSGGCSISMGLFSINFAACPGGGGSGGRGREHAPDKKKPSPKLGICPNVPAKPGYSDLNSDIAVAEQMKKLTYTEPAVSAGLFYELNKNQGPWGNYKYIKNTDDFGSLNPKSPFEDYGNFHYGAVGAAAGYPLPVLLRAAGWYQERSGTSDPSFGHWYGDAPYGDDPKDQQQIKAGFQFYENHCGG